MDQDSSRLRKQLLDLRAALERQLDLVLAERGPLLHASLGTRGRVCGNPGCRCARGERHESKFLSASIDGRVRQVHVPAGDEVEVSRWVERYQRFREVRAQVAELASQQLQLIDRLCWSLLAKYPPGNPLPPPKPRGRRPKREE